MRLLCTWVALAICLVLVLAQTEGPASGDDPSTISSESANRPPKPPPTFRIVAPQVICKPGGNGVATELPKQITISMQTPGGQQLAYRVRMSFEVLGGFRGQQHSLRLWDSVRRLENRMNKRDAPQITEKNQINVNNTELTPGVYYVFEIVGMDADGAESEPQNYTVTFSDGKIKRTNPDGSIIPDDVSFVLLGAPNTYANQDYVVEANPSFCVPRNDYTIAWNMPALGPDYRKYTRTPGNVLRIPAGILRTGQIYVIESSLLAGNESQVLVYQSVKVSVLQRGIQMRLQPDRITIGVGSELQLRAHFVDADYSDELPQIVWRCEMKADTATAMAECPGFVAADGLVQTVEFVGQGEFVVQITITLGSISSTRSCQITVNKDVIVRPSVLLVPSSAVAAGARLEVEMMIDHLVPRCYCEWTVVQEEGYAYFNVSEIPAGLGNMSVLDKEGNFLSELVDYANATMSRELTLLVPARSADWSGLAGDSSYRFRLLCTCPVPIMDTELDDLPGMERANCTSATDLVIHTNAPPAGHPLEVVPLSGIAMRTVFKFTTGVATDEATDYPLQYRFVYTVRLDGQPLTYTIGEYFENTVTSTLLPYAADGVDTAYEVCDSRGACAQLAGPRVSLQPAAFDEEKLLEISETIEAAMRRTEFDGAFRLATLTAISLRNAEQADVLAGFAGTMRSAIGAQVEWLEPMLRAKGDGDEVFVAHSEVVNFINHARMALRLTDPGDVADQLILQQLLQLFDLMEEEEEEKVGPSVEDAAADLGRRKRRQALVAGGKPQTLDFSAKINAQLDIIELLLRNGTEEYLREAKRNLTRRVEGWMRDLCTRDVAKTFDKESVKFEVRSVTYQQIQRSNHTVPHKSKTGLGATVNFNNSLIIAATSDTRYCIGKAWYAGNYVRPANGELLRETFQVVLMLAAARNAAEPPKVIPLVDASAAQGSSNLVAWLPFSTDEESDQLHCQVLDTANPDGDWMQEACIPEPSVRGQFVQCQCNRLGYIRLARNQATETDVVTELGMTDATVTTVSPTSAPNVTVEATATTTQQTEPTVIAQPPTTTSVPNVTTTQQTAPIVIPQPPPTTTAADPAPVLPTVADIPASSNQTERAMLAETSSDTNSSNTGYALAGGALVLGAGIIGGLYMYNRRTRPTQTPAEVASAANPMEAIVNELREPAPIVRYARFHDEQTMRGTPATLDTAFDGH